ncbi:MAG TPA: zinc-binding dehydrogenase [Patescibacteria group bacterium]|nr:zinc-binding dehydrogenase [Patescibacteria group bacterium]
MKALILKSNGGRENLEYSDIQDSKVAANDSLVKVQATSVNRVDIVVRNGYPGQQTPMPHVLGGDIAGIVEMSTDPKFIGGQRVVAYPLVWCGNCQLCNEGKENLCLNWQYFGMHRHGGYASYASVPSKNLIPIPDNVSFEEAAALGVAGLTAYHGLKSVAALQEGEVFMIWGGSGGMGTIAVQIAKMLGATVIATCGKDEKKGILKELGADYVFNHYTDDLKAEVLKLFPNGIDVVMDYVGPKTFQQSFDMVKKGGKIILCGILTGRETNFSIHQTYLRHISIHGINLGTKAEMEDLIQLVADGKLKPFIGKVLPLCEGAEGHRLMESGEVTGKIILKPETN